MVIKTEITAKKYDQFFGRLEPIASLTGGTQTTYHQPGYLTSNPVVKATFDYFPITPTDQITNVELDHVYSKNITIKYASDTPDEITFLYHAGGLGKTETFERGTDYEDELIHTFTLSEMPEGSVEIAFLNQYSNILEIYSGTYLNLENDDILDLEIDNRTDVNCKTLPISTCVIKLKKNYNIEWFTKWTEIEVGFKNSKFRYYVDTIENDDEDYYTLNCVDAIGVLDQQKWTGSFHREQWNRYPNSIDNAFLMDTFRLICEPDAIFKINSIAGYMETSTMREALQQWLFAYQFWVTTDNELGWLHLYSRPVQSHQKVLPTEAIVGSKIITSELPTKLNLYQHEVIQDDSGSLSLKTSRISGTIKQYVDYVTLYGTRGTEENRVVDLIDATMVSNESTAFYKNQFMDSMFQKVQRNKEFKGGIIYQEQRLGDVVYVPTETSWSLGYLQEYVLSFSSFIYADLVISEGERQAIRGNGDVLGVQPQVPDTWLGYDSTFLVFHNGVYEPCCRIYTSSGVTYAETNNGNAILNSGSSYLFQFKCDNWTILPKELFDYLKAYGTLDETIE